MSTVTKNAMASLIMMTMHGMPTFSPEFVKMTL